MSHVNRSKKGPLCPCNEVQSQTKGKAALRLFTLTLVTLQKSIVSLFSDNLVILVHSRSLFTYYIITMAPLDSLSPTLQPPSSPKNPSQALASRRPSHGAQGKVRKTAVEWNTDDIDDGRNSAFEVSDDEDEEKDVVTSGQSLEDNSLSGGQVVDLLDIARPAKPKGVCGRLSSNKAMFTILFSYYVGVAKEFEVVQGSPRIVALPDEPRGPTAKEEDWEDVNIDSEESDPRKSYSAAVHDRH